MPQKIAFIAALMIVILATSCGLPESQNSLSLRPLSEREAINDFQQMVSSMRDYYGPMEYKERRLGFKFDDLVNQYQAELGNAKSDSEIYGVFAQFLARFKDGHIGIQFYPQNKEVSQYSIPIFLIPFSDAADGKVKAYVGGIGDKLKNSSIDLWDEVVSIDGTPTMDFLPIIQKYNTTGFDLSDRHLIFKALVRGIHMTELVPTSNRAVLVLKKRDGSEQTVEAIWEVVKQRSVDFVEDGLFAQITFDHQAAAQNSILQMGATDPFFATPQVRAVFDMQRVSANQEMLERYGFRKEDKIPSIYAALYKFKGKTILLVRNEGYAHQKERDGFSNEDYMKHYRALLDQYDQIADILVIDQNHNGGGSYCEYFYSLFITKERNGFVQACNSDRRWIKTLNEWSERGLFNGATPLDSELSAHYRELAFQVEKSLDANQALTQPLPIVTYNYVRPDRQYNWRKPFFVLADELAGSCADAFPMLVKNNGSAKIFGERTMGLGGNVEIVANLNNSLASVRGTRGLFTTYKPDGSYRDEDFIENNGVTPDYQYVHTVQDARTGFIKYVLAFSEKAVEQLGKN